MDISSLVKRSGMTFELGKLVGIPIKLHIGMLVLLGMLVLSFIFKPAYIAILLIVLLSSLPHELAHVLVAERFNIKARDLWLSPIGGHLRFERPPKDWHKEMAIAFAGPATNLVIGGAFFALNAIASSWLAATIASVNIGFALFNLLPGFPLDGGRMLRAFLSRKKRRVEATKLPVQIGRGIAGLLFLSGVLPAIPFILGLVAALYVLIFNELEWRAVKTAEAKGESDFDDPQDDPIVVSPAPYDT